MKNFPTYFTGEHALSMTMRDYFAAKAMQANLSSPEFLQVVTAEQANGKSCAERVAKISYLYADAMMKARENV